MKKVSKCPFCLVPLLAELVQSRVLRTCNSPSDPLSLYPASACQGCIWIWPCCFKKTVLTSSQGNIVSYNCLMQASINHLEEERPSPSIHKGKSSVGSCSQSVHCRSAHLHGPLGIQHTVTSPCRLCEIHSKKEHSNTSKTRNISSNAIFCFHLGRGADQLTTHTDTPSFTAGTECPGNTH